jgi:hypothetical protein
MWSDGRSIPVEDIVADHDWDPLIEVSNTLSLINFLDTLFVIFICKKYEIGSLMSIEHFILICILARQMLNFHHQLSGGYHGRGRVAVRF